MFNFAGKSSQCAKKAPAELDFFTFWKSLDETYFSSLTPGALETRRKEILEKVSQFSQTHERGTVHSINPRPQHSC